MFVLFLISFDVGRCSLKVIGAEKSERWGLMERPIFNPCFLGQEIWPTNLIPMWTQKVSSVPGSFSEGNHLDKFDHTLMARRQWGEVDWDGFIPKWPWVRFVNWSHPWNINTNLGLVKVVSPIIGVFCWTLLGYIYIYLYIYIYISFIHHQFAVLKFIDWVYRCNVMMFIVTLLWLVFWNPRIAFGAYLRHMGLLAGRQGRDISKHAVPQENGKNWGAWPTTFWMHQNQDFPRRTSLFSTIFFSLDSTQDAYSLLAILRWLPWIEKVSLKKYGCFSTIFLELGSETRKAVLHPWSESQSPKGRGATYVPRGCQLLDTWPANSGLSGNLKTGYLYRLRTPLVYHRFPIEQLPFIKCGDTRLQTVFRQTQLI